MIRLDGDKVRLRALEPEDVDYLYKWENDPLVWEVGETIAPFSRDTLRKFIENQQYDIFRTRQLRLVVCGQPDGKPVGMVDLFDFDPINQRAAVGIIICDEADRRQGYASEALSLLLDYAREAFGLHQVYCGVESSNLASLTLFQSCGFEQIGLKRDWSRTGNGWRDEYLLQKIFR